MVSQTNSSDYYEEYDSQFLETLGNVILPGDVLPEEKIELDEAEERDNDINSEELEPPPPTQPALKRRWSDVRQPDLQHDATKGVSRVSPPEDEDTYGASRFGGFGDYMRRKRAKLQIQNADMVEGSKDSVKSQIFEGLSIYVRISVSKELSFNPQALMIDKWVDKTFSTRLASSNCPKRRHFSTVPRQERTCVRF